MESINLVFAAGKSQSESSRELGRRVWLVQAVAASRGCENKPHWFLARVYGKKEGRGFGRQADLVCYLR